MVEGFIETELEDERVVIETPEGRWFIIKGDLKVESDKAELIITGDMTGDMDLAKEYFEQHAKEWFAKWMGK